MQERRQKAVIFCRVSSKEQEEAGYSLPSQEKFLREYAERRDFEIVKLYAISESASGKSQREKYMEMIEYAQRHQIKILIFEKADRLTRNFRDMVTMDNWLEEDAERQVHLVKDSLVLHKDSRSQEKLNWGIRILFAKNYIDNLSEEVKKGQKEKIAQGHLPTKPPLGYKSIGERGHKIHVPDEKVAPLMKRMFEYYASGQYSIKKLNKRMYEEGLRTHGGFRLVTSRMHTLLQDPFYCGDFLWKKVRYPGKQEPLISKDLFDQCQKIRGGRNIPHMTKKEFTFKRMFRCGECDGTITGEIKIKRPKKRPSHRYVYYHCNHFKPCSQQGYTREEKLEEELFGVFKLFESITPEEAERIRAKIKENHAADIAYKQTSLDALHEQYMRLQKRLDRLYDDHLDERIDEKHWQSKDKEIRAQQESIQRQITKMKSQEAKYFELWIDIIGLAFRMREIYERRDNPEDRRKLLSHIFTDLVLTDQGMTYKLKNSIQKIADRVRQRIDAENTLEPSTNGEKTLYPFTGFEGFDEKGSKLPQIPANSAGKFRTIKKSTLSTLSRHFDLKSNTLLRGLDSNQGHPR